MVLPGVGHIVSGASLPVVRGAAPARFGRELGGTVDARLLPPSADTVRASASIDLPPAHLLDAPGVEAMAPRLGLRRALQVEVGADVRGPAGFSQVSGTEWVGASRARWCASPSVCRP